MTADGHDGLTGGTLGPRPVAAAAPLTGWRRWRAVVVEALMDRRDELGNALWSDAETRRRTLIIAALALIALGLTGGLISLRNLGRDAGAATVATTRTPGTGPTEPLARESLAFTVDSSQLRALSPADARIVNAGMPFTTDPTPAARAYFARMDIQDYARALDCLTAAVYYEAGNESAIGQAAVAQVVLNRMRHPTYPGTVCGVVFQGSERTTGCQFTFTCDGALATPPRPDSWARSRQVASAALNGAVSASVGWSTHYHADYVVPYWASRLAKVRQIGAHIFYRWPGGVGWPTAFRERHGQPEPLVAALAAIATLPPEPAAPLPVEFILPSEPSITPVAEPLSRQTDDASPHVLTLHPVQDSPAPQPPAPSTARSAAADPPAPIEDPASSRAHALAPARTSRVAVPSGW